MDARTAHNPDPIHIKELVKRTGLSRKEVCARMGVGMRSLERWCGREGGIGYAEQCFLEALAREAQA